MSVHAHRGDFLQLAPSIASSIPPKAFTFSLIDPKGFKIDLKALKPLLTRPRSEVVFNFMYEFANRFVEHRELTDTYDRLLPGVDWCPRFDALLNDGAAGPTERKALLLTCFKEAVKSVGGFKYVADVDIRHPDKKRTYYFLVYATREPAGLEVFRDCQVKALEAQAHIAGQRSLEKSEKSGQRSLFGSELEEANIDHRSFLAQQRQAAKSQPLAIAEQQPGISWGNVWPRLLADYAIRKTDTGVIAGELRKDRLIRFPQWAGKKRIPEDGYHLEPA